MYEIKNFPGNDDIKVINKLGAFTVIEYQRDLSVMPSESLITDCLLLQRYECP